MVIKSKSHTPMKPMTDVAGYKTWKLPPIDIKESTVFRQPIEDEPEIKEKTQELISAEKLQAIKDRAHTEGFDQGRAEGLASAADEITNKNNLLSQLISRLADPLQQCGERTQQELLELAFAVARQIVRRELKQDPTQLIAIIREALTLLPVGSKNIRILLHPDDASIVRDVLSINRDSVDSRWQLMEEPSMERGGCLLKTDNSNVDASIDRQIAVLFSRIAGEQRASERKTQGQHPLQDQVGRDPDE